MRIQMIEPKENDNIDCHLQHVGMGGLTCRGARQTGNNSTNEVNPTFCFNCHAGKIYRDVGCDSVTPKLNVYKGGIFDIDSLFCQLRRRETSYEYCEKCTLVTAETTKKLVTQARGLFESHGFYTAFKDIEKARIAFRDGNFENTITRSISCVESVIKIIHEKLDKPLPNKQTVTELWKSARKILKLDDLDNADNLKSILNSLGGLIIQFGGIRNALGDAHGRGNMSKQASELVAELSINTSSTLSTSLIRQLNKITGD